ncbi:hypothetical protein FRX31_035093 [Thalictrum thalictroides]|uniref:Uncharacterized protein n=1 Tax=Thalictrum thalictroides TaxID=46969 RepID=A0A7J6USS1_THATH|nr:hypothetical protein FRX31_035093 [Thalictrum thalictroides]
MKCREGIVCAANSKVTREDDPDFSATRCKLHKMGDDVILMMLGNEYRCGLGLEYLHEAINFRKVNDNPPLTLEQIDVFCNVTLQRTNDYEFCGLSSRFR